MSRTLFTKTYPGAIPRPTVEMIKYPNDNFFMAATPWGNKNALKEITQAYGDFMTASMADREATSPFAKLPTLSPLANTLRAATIYASEMAYKKNNADSYTSACELLVIAIENTEMAWIQVGQPNLLLIRDQKLIALDVAIDLSVDYQIPSPLPHRLVGLDPQVDATVKTMVIKPEDHLVFLARSMIPPRFFTQDFSEKSSEQILEMLFDVAVADEGDQPFWLALLK